MYMRRYIYTWFGNIRMKAFFWILVCTITMLGEAGAQYLEFKESFPGEGRDVFMEDSKSATMMDYYDVKSYSLDLEVDNNSVFIRGNAGILVEIVKEGMDTLVLDLASDMSVDSVILNTQKLVFSHSNDLLNITLGYVPVTGELLECKVYYHGSPADGLYNANNSYWNFNVTWSLSEPFYAKNWFPCKQDLLDKADSSRVFITVPGNLKAGSNGLLRSVTNMPGDKLRYEWYSSYPIAYYLISIAVSDYLDYSFYTHFNKNDSLLVQNYIYNDASCLDYYKEDMDKSAELLMLYSDLYTRYPFYNEKYGHCLIPSGSYMEHQTMSSMIDFNYGVVAHEMAHQWFGDQVTCASWQDIWINEGFASYSEYIVLENLVSEEEADSWMDNAMRLALERPQGSVYVPLEEAGLVNRIFDYRLSYKKGAVIIHMLRYVLDDDDVFYDVLKEFQTVFKDSVASGLDFKAVAERVSGKDLDAFFDQWYFGKGYPVYNISWTLKADSLVIESSQSTSSLSTPLFRMPLEFRINYGSRDTIVSFYQDALFKEFKLKVTDNIESIELDPNKHSLIGPSLVVSRAGTDQSSRDLGFTLYPVPVDDKLNINFTQSGQRRKVRILTVAGQMIFETETADTFMVLDVNDYSSGLYFIEVTEGNSVKRAKFIRK